MCCAVPTPTSAPCTCCHCSHSSPSLLSPGSSWPSKAGLCRCSRRCLRGLAANAVRVLMPNSTATHIAPEKLRRWESGALFHCPGVDIGPGHARACMTCSPHKLATQLSLRGCGMQGRPPLWLGEDPGLPKGVDQRCGGCRHLPTLHLRGHSSAQKEGAARPGRGGGHSQEVGLLQARVLHTLCWQLA